MNVEELDRFLAAEFPQMFHAAERARDRGGLARRRPRAAGLSARNSSGPGGTISGPTMMALADFAMYVGVLASIGPVPLAVTTNLNINFLRKPGARDLIAEMPAAQARQAACGRRGDHPFGRAGRAGRARRPRPIRSRRND